jgi:hypothetical protein
MKISEIINEGTEAKVHGEFTSLSTDINAALPGVWVQRQLRNTDPYMQYRYGLAMAAARADAAGDVSFEQESPWAENLTIVGFTPEDAETIRLADRMMGVTGTRIADDASRESQSTNKVSPVTRPKKNKYGV